MRDGFKIFDADRHVMEPMGMWKNHLSRRYHHLAPVMASAARVGETFDERYGRLGHHTLLPVPHVPHFRGEQLMVGVSEVANIEVGLAAAGRGHLFAAAETGRGQLETMDADGIDAAVLLPTFAPFIVYNDTVSTAVSRAFARAYNAWLATLTAVDPARLVGAALISRHDPKRMIEDLDHGLALGHRAVVLRPNPVLGRTLGAPELASFWAACRERSVPVLVHEGSHTRVATAGADRFQTHFAQHACSHPLEMMMGFLALLEGGVLEDNPALRFAFLESGCGWVPYWLWRLDTELRALKGEVRGKINRPPSEYFRRQCWVAFEPSEALLPSVAEAIGVENMVFGTDFPHPDHGSGIVDEVMRLGTSFGERGLEPLLWSSARTLFGGGHAQ